MGRTLLDIATGGRAKHGGTGKYKDQPGAIPTLPEFVPSLWDKIKEAGVRQQTASDKVLFPAGKNIFGQHTEPFTAGDLDDLAMGNVGGLVTKVSSFKNMERTLPALHETLTWLRGYSPSSPLIKKFTNLYNELSGYIYGDARVSKTFKVTQHHKGNKRAIEKALEKSDKKVADRLDKKYNDIIESITDTNEKNIVTGYRTKSISPDAGKKTASRKSSDLRDELREQRRTEMEMRSKAKILEQFK